MAHLFRIMGRLAGRAVKTHAVDRAVTVAGAYVASEMRLTDIRLKIRLLRKKRTRHITMLGRTVYRLVINGVEPAGDDHVTTITTVLCEIDREIGEAEQQLEYRKAVEKERRQRRTTDSGDGGGNNETGGAGDREHPPHRGGHGRQ